MRLEPLYTVTFTTPEAWNVKVTSNAGIEGRSFLLAEGRSAGRLSARYRAANFPRKRADGALVPEFRGVLETDDGGAILFEWQGLGVLTDSALSAPRLDGLQPPHRSGDARCGRPISPGASACFHLRSHTTGRDGDDGAH